MSERGFVIIFVFLGENKDGRWLERNFQEAPFPPDPLQCFALRATEERSVELIVVNATDHLKELCYITGSQSQIGHLKISGGQNVI